MYLKTLSEIPVVGKKEYFMFTIRKETLIMVMLHAVVLGMLILPGAAMSSVCSSGTGIPPFIDAGASPNLLLLIDNSGSMLDQAFVESDGECFDDSYDDTGSYTGYFDESAWYEYVIPTEGDFSTLEDRFVINDETEATICADSNRSKSGVVCLKLDSLSDPTTVQSFYAIGKFLNWAAPSKFDIQKKILTGGKWEADPNNDGNSNEGGINDGRFVMESRGCSERRFVKEVVLDQLEDGDNYKLTMGIRPPMEEAFDLWDSVAAYNVDDLVRYNDVIYTCDVGGCSAGSYPNDPVNNWVVYKQSRWYPDETYPPGAVVYDPTTFGMYRTVAGGTSSVETIATKLSEDLDIVWEKYDVTHIDLFNVTTGGFSYDACRLALQELGALTGDESDGDSSDSDSRLGRLKTYTRQCMAYENGNPHTEEGYSNAAFNGSMQECWYYNKFDKWQPGGGSVTSLKNACEGLYEFIPPGDISRYDTGYVCAGTYSSSTPQGYAGRCWEPPLELGDAVCSTIDCIAGTTGPGLHQRCNSDGKVEQCDAWHSQQNRCQNEGSWYVVENCVGGGGLTGDDVIIAVGGGAAPGGWTNDPYYVFDDCVYTDCGVNNCVVSDTACSSLADDATCTVSAAQCNDWWDTSWTRDDDNSGYWTADDATNSDRGENGYYCVDQALRDFCANVEVPEVIDPSDATGMTGEVWNAPAMLVDSAVFAQLDKPLFTMKGYISQREEPDGSLPPPPEGVLQEVAGELRMGAMAFNKNGAATECPDTNDGSAIAYSCPGSNYDGSRVIAYIDQSDEHTPRLVKAINDIKANSWTPLAEAMYNAIGYYTQRGTDMRLQERDFITEADILLDGTITGLPWDITSDFVSGSVVVYNSKFYRALDDITASALTPDRDILHWIRVDTFTVWANEQDYAEETFVSFDGKKYYTFLGGHSDGIVPDDDPNTEVPSLLYDVGVQWTPVDPVEYSCQQNHILVITEGASTADINQDVIDFVDAASLLENVSETPSDSSCTDGLQGSTYLDDLTYFAQFRDEVESDDTLHAAAASALYDGSYILDGEIKSDITTHIVTTGSVRDDENDSECNPVIIMNQAASNGGTSLYDGGEDPADLENNLRDVFNDLLTRASAGSAASVISSSRSGAGAVYQAVFWPELSNNIDDTSVKWAGDVHGLFLGDDGLLYEDSNLDSKLTPSSDLNNNGVPDAGEEVDGDGNLIGSDQQVLFYYSNLARRTRACLNITGYIANNFSFCPGEPGIDEDCAPDSDCRELMDIEYIWSARKWLSQLDNESGVESNRSGTDYISDTPARYIFTWNDIDADGVVDIESGENEIFEFLPAMLNVNILNPDRGLVVDDFAIDNDEVSDFIGDTTTTNTNVELRKKAATAVIEWIRGKELDLDEGIIDDNLNGRLDKVLRSRANPIGGANIWRLGDVIHSTPTVVAKPAEAYHQIYRDKSYRSFLARWYNRRQVIYFGANDGMLHAINGGFYDEGTKSFCRELNPNYNINDDDTFNDSVCLDSGPLLGAELMAFVPYNLTPHLKCLTDPDYNHKYYVDQRPRVFDVQIFGDGEPACAADTSDPACIHPGGWGTILVGSMRFGGADVLATDINGISTDNRLFTSSFFILDITNPEAPPELLGEMTTTTDATCIQGEGLPCADMGYTTSSPSMVVMRDTDGSTQWYLVMGSGPATLKGENDQTGKIAVFPLEGISSTTVSSDRKAFRIPDAQPGEDAWESGSEGGVFAIPSVPGSDTEYSFVSDLITVDFDIEQPGDDLLGAYYKSDAVYFGTVDGEGFSGVDSTRVWDGGGRLYRLVTKLFDAEGNKVLDVNGYETISLPSQWKTEWTDDNDNKGPVRLLIDAKAPITASQSVGWDGRSFWVYGGTGRFYDKWDKPDMTQQRFFGIREPITINNTNLCLDSQMSWGAINWDVTSDTLLGSTPTFTTAVPGNRGLLRTDTILVAEKASSVSGAVFLTCGYCVDNDENSDGVSCTSPEELTGCFPDDLDSVSVTYTNIDNDTVTEDMYLFDDLRDYIAGTGCVDEVDTGIDGWYREFHEDRERNIGQSTLLGGLLTYTGYQPYDDICRPEGQSFLYGVHYQTGTAWYETVFGTYSYGGGTYVKDKLSLGRGLSTSPSLHTGSGSDGVTAFVQTSTGEIIKILEENLPIDNFKSGRTSWTDRCE